MAQCNEVGEIGAEVAPEVEEDVGEAEVEEAESRRPVFYGAADRAARTPFLTENWKADYFDRSQTCPEAYELLLDQR